MTELPAIKALRQNPIEETQRWLKKEGYRRSHYSMDEKILKIIDNKLLKKKK
jgi:hypothetical protein